MQEDINFEYNIKREIAKVDRDNIQASICKILSQYYDLSENLLDVIKLEEASFFKNDIAAIAEAKDKTIHFNYYTFEKINNGEIQEGSDEYTAAVNTVLHEYAHLVNHYLRLKEVKEYISNLDISGYEKCTIDTLIDEYTATYESGKLVFAKNEVNKVLPSMCEYISKYRGKRESKLYWSVISNLGIGIAHDTLLVERGEKSQYEKDLNCDSVLEYKEGLEKIQKALNNFSINNYAETISSLAECTSWLCDIFGLDKKILWKIDHLHIKHEEQEEQHLD